MRGDRLGLDVVACHGLGVGWQSMAWPGGWVRLSHTIGVGFADPSARARALARAYAKARVRAVVRVRVQARAVHVGVLVGFENILVLVLVLGQG